MNNFSIDNIRNTMSDANTFLIITHKRPDGDAISSSLAMFWYLLDNEKKESLIDVIIPEYTKELAFVPGTEFFKKYPTRSRYDLAIVVDCSEPSLLQGEEYLKLSDKVICIDHHENPLLQADYSILDSDSASCTSIIYHIFPCENMKYLYCIATGLISDTSNLTLNVTKGVTNIINQLGNFGVDMDGISKKLSAKSSRTEELLSLVIERGKIFENTVFCSYLLQADLLDSEKNLTNVNHKLIIQGLQEQVKFETLILLIENDLGELKGSLRTFNPNIDFNKICSELLAKGKILKGGGHNYSAGCTAIGSLDELFKIILEEILNNK